jgi:hypothetical protein
MNDYIEKVLIYRSKNKKNQKSISNIEINRNKKEQLLNLLFLQGQEKLFNKKIGKMIVRYLTLEQNYTNKE